MDDLSRSLRTSMTSKNESVVNSHYFTIRSSELNEQLRLRTKGTTPIIKRIRSIFPHKFSNTVHCTESYNQETHTSETWNLFIFWINAYYRIRQCLHAEYNLHRECWRQAHQMLSTKFDLLLNNIGCKSKLIICGGSWLSLLNDYAVFKGNDAL